MPPVELDSIPFSWVRKELHWPETIGRGRRSNAVRRLQEWLTLNGHALVIDRDFGPATAFAVGRFQRRAGLAPTSEVDAATFAALSGQLLAVMTPPPLPDDLATAILALAEHHLAAAPREVRAENAGPWVRSYMKGREGRDQPWCAGFVSVVVEQAALALGRSLDFRRRVSCDHLAFDAREQRRFIDGRQVLADSSLIAPGDLFLSRKSEGDWNHTGIVTAVEDGVFESIEGNTNDGGSPEGREVRRRIRGIGGKDFVRIS